MIEQVTHKTHHNSYLHKVQGVAASTFCLSIMTEKGGRTFKIRLDRVGRIVKTKEIRINVCYELEGAYTYPRTEGNLLRMHFKNMDVTRVGEGTKKEPKYVVLV